MTPNKLLFVHMLVATLISLGLMTGVYFLIPTNADYLNNTTDKPCEYPAINFFLDLLIAVVCLLIMLMVHLLAIYSFFWSTNYMIGFNNDNRIWCSPLAGNEAQASSFHQRIGECIGILATFVSLYPLLYFRFNCMPDFQELMIIMTLLLLFSYCLAKIVKKFFAYHNGKTSYVVINNHV